MEDIGKRIREERVRLDATQEYFAALGGVTVQTQRRYEAGARSPDAKYLSAIAHAVDIQYIITGERSARRQTQRTIGYALAHDGQPPLEDNGERGGGKTTALDEPRLKLIVQMVEEHAPALCAEKKAALIAGLYAIHGLPAEEVSMATLRMIVDELGIE